MSGTSMATPHVAGVAALWAEKLAAGGALDARNLEARLTGTASAAARTYAEAANKDAAFFAGQGA